MSATPQHTEATRQRIVGGVFHLDGTRHPGCSPPVHLDQALCTANASSALFLLSRELRPKTLWLPSYLCESPASATAEARRIRFFGMTSTLEQADLNWLEDVEQGDLVLVIDYFGRRVDADLIVALKRRGPWVVEDASQALLTEGIGQGVDFLLLSPRKFVGIPDGGILVDPTGRLRALPLQPPPSEAWLDSLNAMLLRRDFDLGATSSRDWFRLWREANAHHPIGAFGMSHLSRELLLHCVDYSGIAAARVRNYRRLAAHLGRIALFPTLETGVVPLGFPIRHQARDALLSGLFETGIYPPVHWPVPASVPAWFTQSRELASEIMTLPCDQRYGPDDMERVAGAVLDLLEEVA